MPTNEEPDFTGYSLGDWLQYGIDKGWVSNAFCMTHDGDPYMTEEESQEWEDGGDPCCPVVKLI